MTYRPELDGLRGLAILLVLIGHAVPGLEGLAWAGLCLFFVLSGYLITNVLQRNPDRLTFYRHRVARLAPALVILVTVTAAPLAIATVLFAANWPLVAGVDVHHPLGHTWSLAVEEQFYLVWPFLLPFVRLRWLVVVAFGVMGARFLVPIDWYYYATPFRVDGLALGAALAIAGVRSGRGGGVGVLGLLMAGLAHEAAPQLALATMTLASVALVWAAPSWMNVLAPLGRISYALYLYHWPLFLWAGIPGLLAAVPLAVASTLLIEEPIRTWLRRPRLAWA